MHIRNFNIGVAKRYPRSNFNIGLVKPAIQVDEWMGYYTRKNTVCDYSSSPQPYVDKYNIVRISYSGRWVFNNTRGARIIKKSSFIFNYNKPVFPAWEFIVTIIL